MTIHHIINDVEVANGGAQKIVRMLHQGLLSGGVDSRVATLIGKVDGLEGARSFGLSWVRDPRAVFSLVRYIRKNCREGDVLHGHLFPANLFLSLAVRLSGWKGLLVCTEHSTSNRRRGTALGKILDGFLYAPYQRIACISEGAKSALAQWMPVLEGRLVTVQNGAELSDSVCEARANDRRPVIVSVGRLHSLKGLDTALEAVALLGDLDFEYWIAGTGSEEERLKNLAECLGIGDKVRFLGFVEAVSSLLRRADVFLMPSKWEGFGLAAVEAMNARLPCVVSDVDGLREVVTDACAVKVPPESPDRFAAALRRLIVDPSLRIDMGRKGFERSLEFSAESMVDRYITFYEAG